jgi:hypothetical protein
MITSQTFVNVVGNFKREGGMFPSLMCVYILHPTHSLLSTKGICPEINSKTINCWFNHRVYGRENEKSLPLPGSLSTHILPL